MTQVICFIDPGYASAGCRRSGTCDTGFTLIELLVVLAIVALMLTVSMPRYFQHIDIAKEKVLVENLHTVRTVIDKFYADTGRYPESLDELVQRRYLRALPVDPVAENAAGWAIVAPEDPAKSGVYDIHSSAPGVASNGKPFAEM